MKILMLTLYLPYPPTSGGQIRSFNLIKQMSKKHEITLYSIIKKGEEKYAKELEKYCKKVIYFYRSDHPFRLKNVLRTGFSLYPFLVMRNFSDKGKQSLTALLKKESFDVIHVETFYLYPHLPKTSTPVVLVDQTIEFEVYRHFVDHIKWWFLKPLLYIDVAKLRYWEVRFWREANRVVAVSQDDKKVMQKCVPGTEVAVVPNAPGDDLSGIFEKRSKPNFKEPIIFFQSNFLWMQNVEGAQILAKQVFPLIKAKIPSAQCLIVGQNTKGKLENLQGAGVKIVTLDTSDISGIIQAYTKGTVFLAPLWGPGGTRLKILSAMSTGIPVVTTPVGATGLDVIDNTHLLIGKSPKELAQKVISLLTDSSKYYLLQKNAKKLIEQKYSWQKIANDLSRVYEEVAKKN